MTFPQTLPGRYRVVAVALLVLGVLPSLSRAGLGPENVLVVINANSASSREVAHHYARLRQIPDGNLLYLDWQGDESAIGLQDFRTRLLRPVLGAIVARGLGSQIDCITYSCDLPYVVNFDDGIDAVNRRDDARPRAQPSASVNGLTYLWQLLASDEKAFLAMDTNRYFRQPDSQTGDVSTRGFRSWYGWGEDGTLMETGEGARYYLCTKLAVSSGSNANTLDEILFYLRRSAAADGARPAGTIYFVRNDNVRSVARHNAFPTIVRQLTDIDVAAKILDGRLPNDRKDVQGLAIGTSNFDWKASGSRILPGAICDNLTSYGGALHHRTRQTTIDHFLRFGAAGASGTVAEPLAIPAKFPAPSIQLHYARGATLAEAFYQSVASPYQLLIVGDPLCRPWAEIPQVSLAGVKNGQTIRGSVTLTPVTESDEVDRFELFVDGRRLERAIRGESFVLDTTRLADGHHELRVVGIAATSVETQGRAIIEVNVNNQGRRVEVTGPTSRVVAADQTLAINVKSPGAKQVRVLHGSRIVGEVQGEEGDVRIAAKTLGPGPVVLRVIAFNSQQPFAVGKPVPFFVRRFTR